MTEWDDTLIARGMSDRTRIGTTPDPRAEWEAALAILEDHPFIDAWPRSTRIMLERWQVLQVRNALRALLASTAQPAPTDDWRSRYPEFAAWLDRPFPTPPTDTEGPRQVMEPPTAYRALCRIGGCVMCDSVCLNCGATPVLAPTPPAEGTDDA